MLQSNALEYLEHSDYRPKQGVEVLPIWLCPMILCKCKLASKQVHPKNAAIRA